MEFVRCLAALHQPLDKGDEQRNGNAGEADGEAAYCSFECAHLDGARCAYTVRCRAECHASCYGVGDVTAVEYPWPYEAAGDAGEKDDNGSDRG